MIDNKQVTGSVDDAVLSLPEAAKYGKVTNIAIYKAVQQGRLNAFTGIDGRLYVYRSVYDEYRKNRYMRGRGRFNSQALFDPSQGRLSVPQVGMLCCERMGYHYPTQRIYYDIRIGKLKVYRQGRLYMVRIEDALAYIENETQGWKISQTQ